MPDAYKTTAQLKQDALLDWRNEAIDRANAAEARVIVLSEQLDAALRTLATLRMGGRTTIQSQAAQGAVTHDGNVTAIRAEPSHPIFKPPIVEITAFTPAPCDCGIECACATDRKDAS